MEIIIASTSEDCGEEEISGRKHNSVQYTDYAQ